MANNKNQRGLGRGLSALLADQDVQAVATQTELASPKTADSLPIEYLKPNPNQPRKIFDQDELNELAISVSEKGVIQPILVRKRGEDHYEIVAGERRWRAASMAKLHRVPVVVREYNDVEVAEIALIENIQRSALNPMEEALAYQDLMSRHGSTQEELSRVLGKSRPHIANMMRLLRLEPMVQDWVRDGDISFGHARALVNSDRQVEDARLVKDKGISVRELERMLEQRRDGGASQEGKTASAKPSMGKDADTRQLESELSANLGMKVKIDHKDGKGKLTIAYGDLDNLDKLCQLLG